MTSRLLMIQLYNRVVSYPTPHPHSHSRPIFSAVKAKTKFYVL